MKEFYSNGKLLITAEYLVLDGANALALPTKFGQTLVVESIAEELVLWESFDVSNNCWFQAEFRLNDLRIVSETFDAPLEDPKESLALTLRDILLKAREINPSFLQKGCHVKTGLNFPRNWGLGTSSTLINNIASWAGIDAFKLLWNSFGGSGYDIACAQNNTPIIFSNFNKVPKVNQITFNPSFKEQLYFVHLNIKQDSKKGIARYRQKEFDIDKALRQVNQLTKEFESAKTIEDFEQLVNEHEALISGIIGNKPVKEVLFTDYSGAIKSLGAWGGDFVLVTGDKNTPAYFKSKGFETVLPYSQMIL